MRLSVEALRQVVKRDLPIAFVPQHRNLVEAVEPEATELRQHAAFLRDAGGENPVEGADAIGAHQEEAIAEVVDVANFAAGVQGKTVDLGM